MAIQNLKNKKKLKIIKIRVKNNKINNNISNNK